MRRLFIIVLVASFALPATALGKGPSAASIDGPGGGGGITFTGYGESAGSSLGDLTLLAGFFPAALGQEPSPMLPGRPKGELGPRYTITYTVPTGTGVADRIRQDLYPYAVGAPMTYMEPGQKLFGQETPGGWFQADRHLKELLVSTGLPPKAPEAPAPAASPGRSFPLDLAALVVLGLALALATVLVLRRRALARIARSPS
ncbi:MAG TPA: hypothetical protein VHI55_06780 [Gaiellaceae bacterium]|jgi:hypothetical protein|nr:hypothetical protein [Gaiellaceae bacterium]